MVYNNYIANDTESPELSHCVHKYKQIKRKEEPFVLAVFPFQNLRDIGYFSIALLIKRVDYRVHDEHEPNGKDQIACQEVYNVRGQVDVHSQEVGCYILGKCGAVFH